MTAYSVQEIGLDLPALAVRFAARLQEAGVPVGVERSARFAGALTLVRPISRRRLYWTARSTFVTDRSQVPAFDAVFAQVFGSGLVQVEGYHDPSRAPYSATHIDETPEDERPRGQRDQRMQLESATVDRSAAPGSDDADSEADEELEIPVLASPEEQLRTRHFESLEPSELAELYRLMDRLRIETPIRRARRSRRDRHGNRIDVRRTMRASMRTAGDPLHLARRRRRKVPRRIVMLCDISGSMEPYARAYLQFLTSAAGTGMRSGGPVEAFVFATRLTRLTRALNSRNPDRAIQRAAATAPDWSSGTRIGDSLKRFNDRHGRRGMARGAVVVILSDGWERGSPELVGREMQRLSRLAHRIIWVNPRAAAQGFAPKAAGMVAALPYVDSLISGESLAALDEVVRAIGCVPDQLPGADWPGLGTGRGAVHARLAPAEPEEPEDEPWGSATPVRGSSVAMPSGWSPSRGHTTPGWGGK